MHSKCRELQALDSVRSIEISAPDDKGWSFDKAACGCPNAALGEYEYLQGSGHPIIFQDLMYYEPS